MHYHQLNGGISRFLKFEYFSKIFSSNQAITKNTKLHSNNVLINISTKDIQTFDVVHYNKIEHKNIFNIINEALIKDND